MANSRRKKEPNIIIDGYRRIFLPSLAAVLSTLIMVFCVLTLLEVSTNGYGEAPKYLIWVFIFKGLTNVVTFLKERNKFNLFRSLGMLIFDVVLGIVVLFGKNNPYLFCLVFGLYCLAIIFNRILIMFKKRTIRSYVLNGLIIFVFLVIAITLFMSTQDLEANIGTIILAECVVIAIVSFIEVFKVAMSQLRLKTLGIIILRTYALEILFGLMAMMVCFSLVLMYIEPGFTNFFDALWYCFAVVTTIGFGDFTCVTVIGRLLTMLLGVYGLIVVAVITSIFVSFYQETAGKADKKEIKDIKKDEDKKD